jgi:folylpolyglutamate synthase/dihydropteroate synthase
MKSNGKARRIIALWSMLGDKDRSGFLRELSGVVDGWVPFPLDHERAASQRELADACRRRNLEARPGNGFLDGWRIARRWAGAGGLLIVCGSLAAVGEALRFRVGELP